MPKIGIKTHFYNEQWFGIVFDSVEEFEEYVDWVKNPNQRSDEYRSLTPTPWPTTIDKVKEQCDVYFDSIDEVEDNHLLMLKL